MHLQQFLREYLELHGYWVLFIGTFLEGEAILIMAGFLAFQGYLDVRGVILTAFVGSFLGDQVYFYLGYYRGKALLRRFHTIARKFREALRLIEKYGAYVAFISRYTYGFRIVLPIILGVTSLPPVTFLWINLVSALSWAIVFSLAGYLFGKSATLFLDDVGKYEHYLMLALIGFVVVAWLLHLYHAWNLKKPARNRLARMRAARAERSQKQ
ncbi:DedA family protein [Geobacter sp. SVR]|uniref:DedA family protein n=1 Tax=Geobacter sp. SVR TaxID=2495594 RepID=UPI00143EF59B|nr:DedA family protein [Geobacter sp. SVR]BCS53020.1 membrane protein [Geobacter sp. SVR]GCF84405.1 membrane protein [Geobacter sp. SVR]